MGQRQKFRRWKRKRLTEVALGLSPVGDEIEERNAAKSQQVLLGQAKNDPDYYWLACRLAGKQIRHYQD